MLNLKKYHRPGNVRDALELLSRAERRVIVLAGGTTLTPQSNAGVDEVIDLQSTGLDTIEVKEDNINIGAMTRLQALVDHPDMPVLIRDTARLEGPNTLRHAGTIGGNIVLANWESELFAALLVHEAIITIQTLDSTKRVPLVEFEAQQLDGIITGISIARAGITAHERVARTPVDRPIVAVVGRKTDKALQLAACGLAKRPIPIKLGEIDQLVPPADFRGSREYRLAMALLLSRRVVVKLS